MTETEVFQTRLDPDVAERVHDYREERRISKAEATRRLVESGLEELERDADAEDQEDTRDREGLLQIRARIAERFALAGTLSVLVGFIIPLLANVTVTTFTLSVGEFGYLIVLGATGGAVVLGATLVGMSVGTIAEALFTYGTRTGYFSRLMARLAPRLGYAEPPAPATEATT